MILCSVGDTSTPLRPSHSHFSLCVNSSRVGNFETIGSSCVNILSKCLKAVLLVCMWTGLTTNMEIFKAIISGNFKRFYSQTKGYQDRTLLCETWLIIFIVLYIVHSKMLKKFPLYCWRTWKISISSRHVYEFQVISCYKFLVLFKTPIYKIFYIGDVSVVFT